MTIRNSTRWRKRLSSLVCTLLIVVHQMTMAQSNTSVINLLVSTDTMSITSVGHLVNGLQNLPNLNLAFDQSDMDMKKVVKLPKNKQMTVEEVMEAVTKATGMDYEILGQQIILKRSVAKQPLNKYTISGQIKDKYSGEDLIGATVRVKDLNIGTVSNVYGFYSLTLEEGSYELIYTFVGFENVIVPVSLQKDIIQNIELGEGEELLQEVVVVAEKAEDFNVAAIEMSTIDVSIESVKKMPALFGEVDIIKTIQLLPGVKTVGEGSSGFYVRGGNVDQNLVLLDEAPIYNSSHLMGFFSSFNPDAIKDMKLYKGAIPSHYGGRLSSVLDIRMKEGNAKQFAGSGGVGTIMSRLALEAPIGNQASFMVGARRSYLDVMAKAWNTVRGKENNPGDQFYFYDLNAKTNFRIDNKNRFFASGYFGRDVIAVHQDPLNLRVEWGNSTGTVRWNHVFSPKLFSNLTYYYSNYDYFLDYEFDVFRFIWESNLIEHSLKADFGAYLNPSNTIKFGMHSIYHQIDPGKIQSLEEDEVLVELVLERNKSIESAIYINNEQKITDQLSAEYGLRFSLFQNLGPKTSYQQDQNYAITDTINHQGGIFNMYYNLEPRAGLRYRIDPRSALKASYNRTTQYIQLASNGNFSSPFDIWFPSSDQVKPQLADQIAAGYFRNIRTNTIELSAEVYYKRFDQSIDFRDHANLLLNANLEGELRVGIGRAYGLELMAKKDRGRLTGWISYTLSKAEKKIETINEGRWYNAKHDKPHDISVVASYELGKRLSVGANFVYSSGNAVTFPTGRYEFGGAWIPVFSERNGARLPDYHRMDLSATLQGKKNKDRRWQSEWVISVYNVYNRMNAFAINFLQDPIQPNLTYAEKLAIFSIVPSLTYNFRF